MITKPESLAKMSESAECITKVRAIAAAQDKVAVQMVEALQSGDLGRCLELNAENAHLYKEHLTQSIKASQLISDISTIDRDAFQEAYIQGRKRAARLLSDELSVDDLLVAKSKHEAECHEAECYVLEAMNESLSERSIN